MSEKTNHQIVRFVQKLAEKYPQQDIPELFTDVHIRVSQETGDVMAFDDDDNEITRIVVDEWINSPVESDKFFSDVADVLRQVIQEQETATDATSQQEDSGNTQSQGPFSHVPEDFDKKE